MALSYYYIFFYIFVPQGGATVSNQLKHEKNAELTFPSLRFLESVFAHIQSKIQRKEKRQKRKYNIGTLFSANNCIKVSQPTHLLRLGKKEEQQLIFFQDRDASLLAVKKEIPFVFGRNFSQSCCCSRIHQREATIPDKCSKSKEDSWEPAVEF